jgi:protein FAM32A
MPASDYTSIVSGGLKLKGGAKDAGIKKKKKSSSSSKKKSAVEPAKEEGEAASEENKPADNSSSSTALARQAQIDEDDEEEQALERRRSRSSSAVPSYNNNSSTGTGKTEAQRRHEEIKRKRVSEMLAALTSRSRGSHQPSRCVLTDISFSLYSSTSDSGAKAAPKRTSSASKS